MTRLEELLLQCQNGDEQAAEALVEENSGLIWSVARRYLGRGVELDDLYQLGCLGFLKAVYGFDASYGTQFSTYAVPKISGEIRRYLRDDGAVKVSRNIKERAMTIKAAQNHLTQTMGYEPTLQQIAQYTGLTPEEIAIAETATASVESIHQESGQGGVCLEDFLSDSHSEEAWLESISLRQAVEQLPQKEAMVIRLRYFHSMTQQRVARVMQISQVQVSRIEKKALSSLKELIEA